MSNYVILKDERPNPKFDGHIQGILLSKKQEIIPNPFNKSEIIKDKGDYLIKVIDKKSESGKLRDKLSLNIQNDEALFVVNSKLLLLLKGYCENIEFYNLTIKKDAELNVDYKIVNIMNSVNCINHEESKLIYWEMAHETVYNIDELVLNEEAIPQNLNIFLLGEIRGTVIVFNKRLRDVIEQQKFTGFNFCEVRDFVL